MMNFLTPERYVDTFLHALTLLRVDDLGLAPPHDEAELNTVAMMVIGTKMIASAGRDVSDMLLYNLADQTERLLVTAVMPPDGDVVTAWFKARGEYLACRLGAL